MKIYNKIREDFKNAKINKEADKNLFLSVLIGEIQNKAVVINDGEKTYPDDNVIKILKSSLKSIKENIDNDGIKDKSKFHKEYDIVNDYLPQQMSEDDLRKVLTESQTSTLPEMMKYLKDNFSGLYDGKMASIVAKELS